MTVDLKLHVGFNLVQIKNWKITSQKYS